MFDFDDLEETLTPAEEERQQKVVEEARGGLESSEWNVRRDACRLISGSSLGSPAAGLLPRLKELSGSDEDYEVRKAARGAILSLATAGVVLPATEASSSKASLSTSRLTSPSIGALPSPGVAKAAPPAPQPPAKRWSAEDETDEEDVQQEEKEEEKEEEHEGRPDCIAIQPPQRPWVNRSEEPPAHTARRDFVGDGPACSSTSQAYPTHFPQAQATPATAAAAAAAATSTHGLPATRASALRNEPLAARRVAESDAAQAATPTPATTTMTTTRAASQPTTTTTTTTTTATTTAALRKLQAPPALAAPEPPKLRTKFPTPLAKRSAAAAAAVTPEYPSVLLEIQGEVFRMRLEHKKSTPAEVIDIWVNFWGLAYAGRIRFQAQPEEDKKWLNNVEDTLPEAPFVVRLECNVGSILQSLVVACKDYGQLSAAEVRELRDAKSRGSNGSSGKVQRDRVRRPWKEGPSLIPSDPAVDLSTDNRQVPSFDQLNAQKEARHRFAERWADEEQKQRQKEQRARQGRAQIAGLKAPPLERPSRDLT